MVSPTRACSNVFPAEATAIFRMETTTEAIVFPATALASPRAIVSTSGSSGTVPETPPMTRMLRGVVAVLGVGAFLVPASAQPAGGPAPALTVNADPAHPVFAGSVRVAVERPAERIELLAAIGARASAEQNAAATDALLRLVRATVPAGGATALASTQLGGGQMLLAGGPYAGFVRIDLAPPVDDRSLRQTIAQLIAAIGTRAASDPVRLATVVAVGKGYASCAPFTEEGVALAGARVAGYAHALGITGAASPWLHDATRPRHSIDGPPNDEPLCGSAAHVKGPTAHQLPISATMRMHRTYAFTEAIPSVRPYPAVPAESVPPLWAGPFDDVRLRLRSRDPLITLEGHALLKRSPEGTMYEYSGPNGRYFARDVTANHLTEVHQRLHAVGIGDAEITSEIHPSTGRYFVTVRTAGAAFDERVVAAIGGPDAVERRAVRAAPYGPCAASPDAIVRALADAAARAARIAESLGLTAAVRHPVAIVLQHGAVVGECPEGTNLPALPEPIARRTGGALRSEAAVRGDVDDVAVLATFPLAGHLLGGRLEARPATDANASYAVRFGFAPPPFVYPEGTLSGEATGERSLPPQRVRISLQLSPDNANNFRPIDPRFAASLAAQLGAPDASYAAWSQPSQANLQNGDPEPDGLDFVAVLPYHGEKTVRAAEAALHATYAVGYGGFDVVPQRDACADAAVALARDTIRAAAAQANAPAGAHLVAIDLRGPFSVEGLCRAGAGGPQNWSVRNVVVPDIRLAAYARVSYAR
jgi:hypothetical protein